MQKKGQSPNLCRRRDKAPTYTEGGAKPQLMQKEGQSPNLCRRRGTAPTYAEGGAKPQLVGAMPQLMQKKGQSPNLCRRRGKAPTYTEGGTKPQLMHKEGKAPTYSEAGAKPQLMQKEGQRPRTGFILNSIIIGTSDNRSLSSSRCVNCSWLTITRLRCVLTFWCPSVLYFTNCFDVNHDFCIIWKISNLELLYGASYYYGIFCRMQQHKIVTLFSLVFKYVRVIIQMKPEISQIKY